MKRKILLSSRYIYIFILSQKKKSMKMLLMCLSVWTGICVWTWTQKTFTDWSESYFLDWNTIKWIKSHTGSTGKQRRKLSFIWECSFPWQSYHSTSVAKHCWKCLFFLRISSCNKIFVSLSFLPLPAAMPASPQWHHRTCMHQPGVISRCQHLKLLFIYCSL